MGDEEVWRLNVNCVNEDLRRERTKEGRNFYLGRLVVRDSREDRSES